MKALSNSPFAKSPTLIILETDDGWDEAYSNWCSMKNPTDNPEWDKGIFLHEIEVI